MQETLTTTLANMEHFLNVQDVGELLNIQPETIYRYCKQDFMPHFKIGNSLRFDPRQLATWVQVHQFSAGGNVADKITDWVIAHVCDRTLGLPIPAKLTKVLRCLESSWVLEACTQAAYDTSVEAFQAELNRQLTLAEQRELLAELLWIAVYAA